jgi:hypothetical protein
MASFLRQEGLVGLEQVQQRLSVDGQVRTVMKVLQMMEE